MTLLTNPNFVVDTTFSAKNISSAASVYAWTVSSSGFVVIQVKMTVAGNGDYVAYLTHQWLGTGTAAVVLPKTTGASASGETVIEFSTLMILAQATDVFNVMIDGLAGDTSVSGSIRIASLNFSLLTTAEIPTPLDAAGTAAAVLDAVAANYNDPNTIGEAINNAGSGSVVVNTYLAVSAAQAAGTSSGSLVVSTNYTMRQQITSTITDNLNAATNVIFALKRTAADSDDDALILIDTDTGLLRINGQAVIAPLSATDGDITIGGSSGAWTIDIYASQQATAHLDSVTGDYVAEVKYFLTGATDDALLAWEGPGEIVTGAIKALA